MPNVEQTAVSTSTGGVIKSAPGRVLWMLVSAAATGGAWQVNDSTDDSGTDLVSGVAPANSMTFLRFGNVERGALQCATGIFIDITGTNVTITTGFI